MAVTFDTLELAKKLEAAGFTEAQAEGLASSLSHIQTRQLENLATKQDLEELRQATKQDLEELRQATKQDLEELRQATRQDLKDLEVKLERRMDKHDARLVLLQWMLGFVLAGIAALVLETFF